MHLVRASHEGQHRLPGQLPQGGSVVQPVVQAPDGLVKCELRLLYTWPQADAQPKLVAGLARLSRGEMIGVDFNKELFISSLFSDLK